jgi:hypothetical protein
MHHDEGIQVQNQTEAIRHDMSQFYPLKDVLGSLFGSRTYNSLKENADLDDWKTAATKLLKAIRMAVTETVQVADAQWHDEVRDILKLGQEQIISSDTPAELFASLSAVLARLVFVQVGFFPLGRNQEEVVPLEASRWKLDAVRTVQYVQSAEQRRTAVSLRESHEASRKNPSS